MIELQVSILCREYQRRFCWLSNHAWQCDADIMNKLVDGDECLVWNQKMSEYVLRNKLFAQTWCSDCGYVREGYQIDNKEYIDVERRLNNLRELAT